jgi:hypothetical protein
MTRTVKGILIDPFACTVTEVEHDAERYGVPPPTDPRGRHIHSTTY